MKVGRISVSFVQYEHFETLENMCSSPWSPL